MEITGRGIHLGKADVSGMMVRITSTGIDRRCQL